MLVNKNLRFKLNSVETDKCGRLVIIDCVINFHKFTLVSLYGPKIDDPTFFYNLIMKLATTEGQFIVGGDFNLVLNPSMDRSSPKSFLLSKSAATLVQAMKELGLSDAWRSLHPNQKDYSFYSSVHNIYCIQELIFFWHQRRICQK